MEGGGGGGGGTGGGGGGWRGIAEEGGEDDDFRRRRENMYIAFRCSSACAGKGASTNNNEKVQLTVHLVKIEYDI